MSDKKVLRIDYSSTEDREYLIKKLEKDDDGFMKGRAVITNVGVFTYALPGGQVRRELRPPEEVFNSDSLNSLAMVPLTNDHPSERVNSSNIKQYQVGTLGDMIDYDSYHVTAPVVINDEATIEEVKMGKQGLSAGYTVDLEESPGVWMGVPYDAIQRNIRYNHVAIVERGRAGDAAKLHLDGLSSNQNAIGVNKTEDNMSDNNFKKIKLDGIEYEAEETVLTTLNGVMSKLDSAEKEINTYKQDKGELESKITELTAKLDSATEEVTELKKEKEKGLPQEKIDEAVKAKLSILSAAEKAGVEVKEDMTDLDVKKAVIISVSPSAKEKLDSADEAYVQVRFDVAVETMKERESIDAEKKQKVQGADLNSDSDEGSKELTADEARAEMIKHNQSAWKKGE